MGGSPTSLLEFQAFDSAVQAMKEKLRRSLLSRERLDVLDGLVQPRMRVVFLPAVATSPAAIILFDDAEEPGHRTSIRLAASLKDGPYVLISICDSLKDGRVAVTCRWRRR